MSLVSGQCFCGSVRFTVDGPEKGACLCYCESCQRAAGAPVVAWATYMRSTFRLVRGDLRSRQSSAGVTRGHCAECGSSISYENKERPGEIDISLNTLDDPSEPTLQAHIWTEDKQPWMEIRDGLPVYAKNIG